LLRMIRPATPSLAEVPLADLSFVVGAFATGLWLTGHALWGMAADAAARRRD